MLSHLRFSHRRLQLSSIVIVVLSLTLLGAYLQKASNVSPIEAAATRLSPHQAQGDHPIVQLFQVPGFIYPSINGVPEWTLYANGLLIFKAGNGSELIQAHLSPNNVRSLMNVIVHQNNFFASTRTSYGRPIPDVGSLLLSVDVNGQHKQIRLYGEPTTATDEQTRHVFAIKNFLFNYRPASTQPYIPPGIALIALPQDGNSSGVPTWPYKDISLARIAAQECPFLSTGSNNCPSITGNKAGIVAILGQPSRALLQQTQNTFYTPVKEQGKIYRLLIWPLLPDALYTHQNGVPTIEVAGASNGTWPLIVDRGNNSNSGRPTSH
jgi:hypothetical protein